MMQKRQILRGMLFFLFVCFTLVMININIAIISITRPSQKMLSDESTAKNVKCPNTTFFWIHNGKDEKKPTLSHQENSYDWSDYEKRMVLSAYNSLSWISILPGSILAQKYGSKIVLGFGIFTASVLSSSIPYLAEYGANRIFYIRMLQGILSMGAITGGATAIVGNWSSGENRAKFFSVFLVGSLVGLGFGNCLFGYMGEYLHWKYIFHLTSFCGSIWAVLWYFLIFDHPSQHPTLSIKEKNEILKSMTRTVVEEHIPIPWREILTSVPLALCDLVYSVSMHHLFILIAFMPLYLRDTYALNSNEIGIIVCVPQIICGISTIPVACFSDYIIKKEWLSLTQTRKVFNLLGAVSASIPLIVLTLIECNLIITITLYSLSTISRIFVSVGVIPLAVDLSPKFCGTLQGRMGTEAEMITLALSTGLSYFSKSVSVEEFWKIIFYTTAATRLIAAFIFCIWGTAEVQWWNEGSKKHQKRLNRRNKITEPLTTET